MNDTKQSALHRAAAALFATAFLCSLTRAEHVILPAEGTVSNRLHMQFRWAPVAGAVEKYRLQIVEDDGSADPFVGGLPITTVRVEPTEPRTVVTRGLEFGRSYAWRVIVRARIEAPETPEGSEAPGQGPSRFNLRDVVSPVRRFETKNVTIDDVNTQAVPPLDLVFSADAELVEPGVTLFGVRRRMSPKGHILAVDPSGKLILHLTRPGDVAFGDVRMMENGRLFWQDAAQLTLDGSQDEITCRTAVAGTLAGHITWQSSTELCDSALPAPFERAGVHHEVFPMPSDAPRGANFLLLEYDNRIIPYTDVYDGTFYPDLLWQGDVVNEVDRHTGQVVKSWSTFDGVALEDHLPMDHHSGVGGAGGDWNHANAAIYDVVEDRVWISLREQSRMVAIDWGSDPPQVEVHLGDDSIVASDLYQGPFPSGDVDFGDNFFSFPHAPQVLPNGNLLVYNNGNYIEPYDPGGFADRLTTAVEIAFDDPAAPTTAVIVNELTLLRPDLETAAFAPFVGDADRLPGGNTLMVDGPDSAIMELDPAGNAVWFLDAGPSFNQPGGVLVYRAERIPELIVDTPGDTDGDWDVDLEDWARLQVAYGQAARPLAFPDTLCDFDGDGEIDVQDLQRYAYWLTGPGR